MTQREAAIAGIVTHEMQRVAEKEGLDPETIRKGVASGAICILSNSLRHGRGPVGIGKGLRTKVNANIGTSPSCPDLGEEIEKLDAVVSAGADTVMDLSTGKSCDIDTARKAIISRATVPVGTVPVYQAAVYAMESRGSAVRFSPDELFEVIEAQARDGVDFMTVHCGVTLSAVGACGSKVA